MTEYITKETEIKAIQGLCIEKNTPQMIWSTDAMDAVRNAPDGWISVKSKLPEINEPVLFTGINDIGNRYPAQKGYYSGDEWYTFGGLWDTPLDRVTHWMPLPEPPKDGEQNDKL